ncbi:hypothetical protein FRC02_002390 [Tulasnella sp. 418]|nr:hypothetical protein FRC02_002390 [Tulasnella sp. 418]
MPREVYVPRLMLDRCRVCDKKTGLRLCSLCAERAYCSKECQTVDWKNDHKVSCPRHERIDIETFYPFLAGLVRFARYHPAILHPASRFCITNHPVAGTSANVFPIPGTNESATTLIFGDPCRDPGGPSWWRTAPTAFERAKLLRRILWEGHGLLVHLALAFAILCEIYTIPNIRLKYRTSPIADFGIIQGCVRVINEDRLAYRMPDGTTLKGDDPLDHWWIYFTTTKKEEVTLDMGMYTFNLCTYLDSSPYFSEPGLIMPALFVEREISHQPGSDRLYTERRRFSVLRNPALASGARVNEDCSSGAPAVLEVFQRLAGRPPNDVEKTLAKDWVGTLTRPLREEMKRKSWKNWPAKPNVLCDMDIHELEEHYREQALELAS